MTKHIKTLLTPFIQSKQLDWKIKLLEEWPRIMGSLATNVSIAKIYEDTVVLGVYDSCWLQELYLLSPTILQTINENLDQPRIKTVRFKQVGSPKQRKKVFQKRVEKTAPISLNQREKTALSRIKNESLRSALQSFLIRCHKEKKK